MHTNSCTGHRLYLSNYGPISIISTVVKMFGRIVRDQCYSYLITNELLSEYQSVFRPTYSTVTAFLETTIGVLVLTWAYSMELFSLI